MSAGQITAEFFGGPADGRVQVLPDLRDRYRFPITSGVEYWQDGAPTRLPVAEYLLAHDSEFGLPRRSDDGRYRYEFKEMTT